MLGRKKWGNICHVNGVYPAFSYCCSPNIGNIGILDIKAEVVNHGEYVDECIFLIGFLDGVICGYLARDIQNTSEVTS